MPRLKRFAAGGVLLALWWIGGCGRSQQATVPVSGVVTLDGKPVPNVLLVFTPTQAAADRRTRSPDSSGVTDEHGRFELETFDGRGAVAGEHVVALIARPPPAKAGSAGPAAVRLPPEASDRSLTFVVPATGPCTADFALVSAPGQAGDDLAAAPTAAVPSGRRETAGLYAAAVALWLAALAGCLCWWRVNVRQIREHASSGGPRSS